MATDCLRRRLKNALMRGTPINLPESPFEQLHAKGGCIVVKPKMASSHELFLPVKRQLPPQRHGRPGHGSRCHAHDRRTLARSRS